MMRKSRLVRAIVLLGLLLIAFGILRRSLHSAGIFGTLGYTVRAPLQWVSTIGRTAGNFVRAPFSWRDQAEERDKLVQEVNRLLRENARQNEVEKENAELRRALNFFEQEKQPAIAARVIGSMAEAGGTFFILNRGSADGVEAARPVTIAGVIIGKITRAHSRTSIFSPLSSLGMKTAAAFPGGEKTAGIVEGEFNTNLVLHLIPKDIAVEKNMTIITSGLEDKIPRGLIIGQISEIISSPEDLFQSAYLITPIRIEYDSIVTVLAGTPSLVGE